jgi:peroxiredoxin Q/BCP
MATPTAAPLREGSPAPDISLLTDAGEPFRLSDLRGKTVVLYFYPKADTPGCTTEACEFRDSEDRFDTAGTVIVGVSPDPVEKQARFKAKYQLPFTLLSDTERTAAEAYGVWREKNMYGKKTMGIVRSTFLIGPDGNIRKIFAKVRAAGHAAQVMEALAAL